ncbi:crotonase/enoyl-CoA hydratase family protein [Pararhodobacter oceanensis]|uniref:crotonase/enoyl-CoA hydratase family protein n=1 Tax=Pararhodobacter oceanensis TaxID=2172121 RepID=UPI003A8F8ED5
MSVRIEKSGPVWTIIHSRPEARNAMDLASATALYDAFQEFDADDSASAAVFWGEGGAFCAGWDLKHAAALTGPEAMDGYDIPDAGTPPMAPMGPSRLDLSKPVIAAVAGPAVAGGMELAIWTDIRVMEESAFMGVYCRRWGVPLIDGGTVRLPRLVGEGRAMDLILTGRRVEAAEALRIGLCEYVVPEGEARAKAEALAHDIARFPQTCMRADRHSARAQHGLSELEALRQEWRGSKAQIAVGIKGAGRFASGKGRGGDFGEI